MVHAIEKDLREAFGRAKTWCEAGFPAIQNNDNNLQGSLIQLVGATIALTGLVLALHGLGNSVPKLICGGVATALGHDLLQVGRNTCHPYSAKNNFQAGYQTLSTKINYLRSKKNENAPNAQEIFAWSKLTHNTLILRFFALR